VSKTNGSMYFDLGTISEDIMRDSRQFFENAIPTSANGGAVTNTRWGRVPFEPPVVNAFDNDPARRPLQDLGLDGLNDEAEKNFFGVWYNKIMNSSLSPNAKAEIAADPSNDNFVYFRDQIYESNPPGLLKRYSKFNNQQGNSPVNNSSNLNPSATNLPDGEDLNQDKSLNENESYYRYPIKMVKGPNSIQVGNSTVTVDGLDFQNDPVLKDLITDTVVFNRNGQYYIWYRFKLPLDYTNRQQFGGIQDFRSIRFMRMVLKGFDERTTFRFATLELGRNQWRRYSQTLKGCGNDDPNVKRIPFDVNAVSIEQNSARTPFNYTIPYGIQRQQSVGAFPDVLQNEQALSMSVCDLEDCDARAIFKSLNLDLRRFKTLKMFVHAESKDPANPMDSTDVKAFLRIGSDFVRNYYEYEIPIDPSRLQDLGGNRNPDSREYKEVVWKPQNSFDFPLQLLIDVKKKRNLQPNWPAGTPYEIADPDHPNNKVRVVGNPNLGYAKGVMFGVRNSPDVHKMDKQCFEVWINELRLNGFSEQGGYAGQARVDMKLADLGNISMAGSFTSKGWGSIEQKINQRQREDVMQVDVSTNLELHKLLPEKAGVRIPFYAQYSNTTRTPEYDPYDLDIKLRDKLRDQTDPVKRDSIRNAAQDVTVVRGYNFTNVRKERKGNKKVSLPWDISNFSLTYAYNQTRKHNPFILLDQLEQRKGAIDYQYSTGLKPFTPFKKLIKKDKYLKFLSEFNLNPIPNTYGFNTNLERFAGKTVYRFAGEDPKLNTYYNRRFTWDRNYNLGWDIAKSLRFNFDATARSIIDEPYAFDNDGNVVSQKVVRDSIWKNVLKLGRPKNYTHSVSLNYTLPFKTIPFLDFITVKASYTGGYTWTAQSLKLQNLDAGPYQNVENSRNLGNVIQNNSVRQINGDMDFTKLYDKSKYLAKIDKPGKPAGGGNGKGKPGKGGADDPGGSNPDNMGPGGAPEKGGRSPGGAGKDLRPGGGGKGKDSVSGGGGGKNDANLSGTSGKDSPAPPPDKNATKNNLPAGGNNGLNPAIDPATGRPTANPNAGALNNPSNGQASNSSDPNAKDGKGGKDDKDGKSGGGGGLKGGKDKKERVPTLAERIALRPLMLVRKARFTYSENYSTVIPGFTPGAKILGQSSGFSAPGWAFVAGIQPSSSWLDEAGQNGWITYRPELNQQVLRNYTQNLDLGVTVEPFTDFRVEISANRQYVRNSTELFKDQNITSLSPDSVDFQHKAARDFGSFTVSYFTMNTLFNNDINGLFKRYESYRPVISKRLGVLAGNTGPHEDPNYAPSYTRGHGGTNQEVLIPAFVAAYTEKDPNTVGLNLFKTRPALNWKLSYNGL
ncbi:MAG: cell surface protein SprA, partial [Bacteroidota bacterium]